MPGYTGDICQTGKSTLISPDLIKTKVVFMNVYVSCEQTLTTVLGDPCDNSATYMDDVDTWTCN